MVQLASTASATTSKWARGPSERDALWEEGYRPYQEQDPEPVAQAPQPQSLSKATGPDGKEYWVDPRNPTAPPVPVFPGMQAQQEAAPAEALSGRPPGARVSELESKAIQAADRVGNSLEILTGQTEDGQRLFDLGASTAQKSLGAIPGVGNFAVSGDFQRYEQALADASQALLRLETGAAAPDTEVREIKKRYGPAPRRPAGSHRTEA